MFNPQSDTKERSQEFNGFYRGVVVDNNDPTKSGRVTIRVFPMFRGVSDAALPWAILADTGFGGSANTGSVNIPMIGSHVWLFFENGDHRFPVYFAGAPAIQNSSPDLPKTSREADPTISTVVSTQRKTGVAMASGGTWDEPTQSQATVYPNNHVWKTSKGLTIELDETDGAMRFHIFHPSGTRVEVDNTGNEIHHVQGDSYDIVVGNGKIYITGNADTTVDGNDGVKVGGNLSVVVGGNADITVTGNSTITATDVSVISSGATTVNSTGAVSVTSGASVTVSAPSISLN